MGIFLCSIYNTAEDCHGFIKPRNDYEKSTSRVEFHSAGLQFSKIDYLPSFRTSSNGIIQHKLGSFDSSASPDR